MGPRRQCDLARRDGCPRGLWPGRTALTFTRAARLPIAADFYRIDGRRGDRVAVAATTPAEAQRQEVEATDALARHEWFLPDVWADRRVEWLRLPRGRGALDGLRDDGGGRGAAGRHRDGKRLARLDARGHGNDERNAVRRDDAHLRAGTRFLRHLDREAGHLDLRDGRGVLFLHRFVVDAVAARVGGLGQRGAAPKLRQRQRRSRKLMREV